MKLSGMDLALFKEALHCILAEINNQIVTCPDPEDPQNVEPLRKLEKKKVRFEALLDRARRSAGQNAIKVRAAKASELGGS